MPLLPALTAEFAHARMTLGAASNEVISHSAGTGGMVCLPTLNRQAAQWLTLLLLTGGLLVVAGLRDLLR